MLRCSSQGFIVGPWTLQHATPSRKDCHSGTQRPSTGVARAPPIRTQLLDREQASTHIRRQIRCLEIVSRAPSSNHGHDEWKGKIDVISIVPLRQRGYLVFPAQELFERIRRGSSMPHAGCNGADKAHSHTRPKGHTKSVE